MKASADVCGKHGTAGPKFRALKHVVRRVVVDSSLTGMDFADVNASRTEREFPQDGGGVLIRFAVSYHAMGKLDDEELWNALSVLGVGRARQGEE